jgi:hypothetical protein
MRYEEIGDPVEVITLFRNGQMSPLRFRWNHHVYKVSRVNGGWISEEGVHKRRHFAVCAGSSDVYELSYAMDSQCWLLERVCMAG